jgi:hypothetical protein
LVTWLFIFVATGCKQNISEKKVAIIAEKTFPYPAWILHLVNFDSGNPSVPNMKVDVLVPEGKKIIQVTVLSPDGRDDEILNFKENAKHTIFTVPKLSTYNMVVIKLE